MPKGKNSKFTIPKPEHLWALRKLVRQNNKGAREYQIKRLKRNGLL